jgi:RHS repeat-associated protein
VTALAVPSGGDIALAGSYRYDPFGRLIGTPTGLAARNTQRFSSKEWHNPSGFYYFGYRFYDPATQRWLNRDPMAEEGGVNLYGFNYNSPLNWIDTDGLEPTSLTHYEKSGVMVHSEVPSPGGGQGGVHIQVGDSKYHFDTQQANFVICQRIWRKKS